MSNKKFVLCMSYDPNNEEDQCRDYSGKCEHHEECTYKSSKLGFRIYTWNNFRTELLKSLVDLVHSIDELDEEYENVFRFNFKAFKIKLKVKVN